MSHAVCGWFQKASISVLTVQGALEQYVWARGRAEGESFEVNRNNNQIAIQSFTELSHRVFMSETCDG